MSLVLVCLAIPHTRVQVEWKTNIAEFVSIPAWAVVPVAMLAAGILGALQSVGGEFRIHGEGES